MKSSAYIPPFYTRTTPSFLQENLEPAPFYELSKNLSKISVPYLYFTLLIFYIQRYSQEIFAQTVKLFSKKQFGQSLGKSRFNYYLILFAVNFSWLILVNLDLILNYNC